MLPRAPTAAAKNANTPKSLGLYSRVNSGDASTVMACAMATLARSAPRLNWDDLTQIPALPLGSWLNTDPWDDSVHELNAKLYAPLNAREKMPLEVTPIYYRLRRYDEEVVRLSQPAQPASASAATSPASESSGTDESSRGTSSKDNPKRVETPGPEGGTKRERPQPENRPQLKN